MNSAIPLVGTDFQFNVVSKWEKYRMLCSCFRSTSLPQIDDSAEESDFLSYFVLLSYGDELLNGLLGLGGASCWSRQPTDRVLCLPSSSVSGLCPHAVVGLKNTAPSVCYSTF